MKKFQAILTLLLISIGAQANVTMPGIFGNNMVLQRNKPIPVWGWATAGETVIVSLNKQKKRIKADKSGNWMVKLSPENVGGPYTLSIKGKNSIDFLNVLIGEVWLCSGQSNMEWALSQANNAATEIAEADYPQIRHVKITQAISKVPEANIKGGRWDVCHPDKAGKFSAVAYFFARKLYQELKIPIGLVNTSWGGSNIETWISREAFQSSDVFRSMINAMPIADIDSITKIGARKLEGDMQRWREDILPKPLLSTWHEPDFDDKDWKKLSVPDNWERQGLYSVDGVLLFRKSFNVDKENAGKPAVLELAKIDDNDVTYINGVRVGATDGYMAVRKYTVPAGILKAGRNVVAIRITDVMGGGGIYSESPLKISVGTQIEPLAGEWAYKFESINDAVYVSPVKHNQYPTMAFNAMIHPLLPYAIKGAIWYQGESNGSRGWQYRTAFPLMINDWRNRWNQGDFPFYFAQLTSFDAGASFDRRLAYNWAELREAQASTLSLPNTGMAVTGDVGDPNDIHPRNKQDVGLRLALIALKDTYNQNIISSGPVFQSMKTEENRAILTFSNIGSGLMVKDKYGYLSGFELAGADKSYFYAKAYIEGNNVIVYSDNVTAPVAVRFGWHNDISDNNLYNKEGLPAAPFRTDNWERGSVKKKFELY